MVEFWRGVMYGWSFSVGYLVGLLVSEKVEACSHVSVHTAGTCAGRAAEYLLGRT